MATRRQREEDPRPAQRVERFVRHPLTVVAFAALLTFVFGGYFGERITHGYQDRSSEQQLKADLLADMAYSTAEAVNRGPDLFHRDLVAAGFRRDDNPDTVAAIVVRDWQQTAHTIDSRLVAYFPQVREIQEWFHLQDAVHDYLVACGAYRQKDQYTAVVRLRQWATSVRTNVPALRQHLDPINWQRWVSIIPRLRKEKLGPSAEAQRQLVLGDVVTLQKAMLEVDLFLIAHLARQEAQGFTHAPWWRFW